LKKSFCKYAVFILGLLLLNGISCLAADTPFLAWTKQVGSASSDEGNSVAIDSAGNVYITGFTGGDLDGNSSAGSDDIFLSKFGGNGQKYWTRQIGTADNDVGYGVTTDSSGYIYVTGIISGDGNLATGDIIVLKYDSNGNRVWLKTAGTNATNTATGIAADNAGNIYVTGWTTGSMDGNPALGGADIFLIKYDSNGNKIWTKQTGTSQDDTCKGVAVDSSGNIYLTGYTFGGLDGNPNQGGADIFIMKYDANGNKLWTKETGRHKMIELIP